MIFKPELAAKVLAGEKTVTRRLCSENERSPWWWGGCAYKPGQVFAVQPGRGRVGICDAIVVNATRGRLGVPKDDEVEREGFSTFTEFQRAFCAINDGYDPNMQVWRVEFLALNAITVPLVAQSLRQEKVTGADSIPTIVRLYEQNEAGEWVCCWPGCPVAWRDPVRLWQHVHEPHDSKVA